MSLLRPFPGLRPASAFVDGVIAPPYDVLNTEEARQRAAGKPNSFLHISKPEIDLPAGTDPYSDIVYAKARENFARMLGEKILVQDTAPYYYAYRLILGDHAQTGLVAAASVADYETNRIRKHEFTRPDKEDDRVRQIEALNAQTGPVFLTYRHSNSVNQVIDAVCTASPDVSVTADDEVSHSLWVIQSREQIEVLTKAFDAMSCLYIADGHHRSAAAARVAQARRGTNPARRGTEPYEYFLAVVFPDDQMRILDYNRVIKDLNGLDPSPLIARIKERFSIATATQAVKPSGTGRFGMYLKGQWFQLTIQPQFVPNDDPVRRLDVSLLQDNLISPVLGIVDPRRDKRIDFIGGIRGLGELVKRVDSGAAAVAFSVFPTSMTDLMAVADKGAVMPPKSTWFEPKLADGLVSHVLW